MVSVLPTNGSVEQTIVQGQKTNRSNFLCELCMHITVRDTVENLQQWEVRYGLALFSTEVRTAQLKVIAHVPSMWQKLQTSVCVEGHALFKALLGTTSMFSSVGEAGLCRSAKTQCKSILILTIIKLRYPYHDFFSFWRL